jgi:hypothetical protein
MSQVGSGAQIFGLFLQAGLRREPPPGTWAVPGCVVARERRGPDVSVKAPPQAECAHMSRRGSAARAAPAALPRRCHPTPAGASRGRPAVSTGPASSRRELPSVPARPDRGVQVISGAAHDPSNHDAMNISTSSSTLLMPAIPKLSTSTLTTLGDKKPGSVGPRWMSFTPRYSRDSRTMTAFCSYQAML